MALSIHKTTAMSHVPIEADFQAPGNKRGKPSDPGWRHLKNITQPDTSENRQAAYCRRYAGLAVGNCSSFGRHSGPGRRQAAVAALVRAAGLHADLFADAAYTGNSVTFKGLGIRTLLNAS